MTRSVALRAFLFFTACAVLLAATGIESHARAAEFLFLVSGTMCGIMLLLVFAMPSPALVPVRVRRKR